MAVKNWSNLERALAGVAVAVFVGVAVLGVIALRSDEEQIPEGCEGASLDSDFESDDSPADVLRAFVQSRPDEFPVDDNWLLESDDDGLYRFVNDTGGRYEIEVRDGLVRRFLRCPGQ